MPEIDVEPKPEAAQTDTKATPQAKESPGPKGETEPELKGPNDPKQ